MRAGRVCIELRVVLIEHIERVEDVGICLSHLANVDTHVHDKLVDLLGLNRRNLIAHRFLFGPCELPREPPLRPALVPCSVLPCELAVHWCWRLKVHQ